MVQISLDLSCKYNSNNINNLFLWLLVPKLFRSMLGKLEIQLARIYRTGIGTTLAVVKPFLRKKNSKSFQVFLQFILTSQFWIFVNILIRNDSTSVLVRQGGFTKVKNSILFRNICYNLYIRACYLNFQLSWITLEPIIVEKSYRYHWNCIYKTNPVIFEPKL